MKTELNKNEKLSTEHETPPIANVLLAAAASWWNGLTVFKRELYIGRHYADDTPTNDKINTLYKMYNDWSNEELEQVSSCR
jgi:hypothetical protein